MHIFFSFKQKPKSDHFIKFIHIEFESTVPRPQEVNRRMRVNQQYVLKKECTQRLPKNLKLRLSEFSRQFFL